MRASSVVRLAAIAAFVAACGSAAPATSTPPSASVALPASPGSQPSPTAAATRTPRPTTSPPDAGPPLGALPPGEYTAHFEPAFSFTLGAGWERRVPDPAVSDSYLMLLHVAGDGGELLFIEASDLGVDASLERFDRFRFTESTPAQPATLGGVAGLVIAGGRPPSVTAVRGVPVGSDYVIEPADQVRVTAVEVEGVTVTVIVEGNVDDFAAFVPLADEVLGTIAFP